MGAFESSLNGHRGREIRAQVPCGLWLVRALVTDTLEENGGFKYSKDGRKAEARGTQKKDL